MAGEPAWPPEPLHVAVDVAVCTVLEARLHALLYRRPYDPFEGWWALPGTFSRPDETLDESARRALEDKTGVAGVWLEQLATFDQIERADAPGRDPRGRVVSVAYLALIDADSVPDRARDDVRWWPLDGLPDLPFDHATILERAVERLRAKTRYAPVAFQLLGEEEFTLTALHEIYEAVLGERLDVRNFRRDLRAAGVIEETGRSWSEGPGRPAKLYRYVPGSFAVSGDERRVAERIDRDRRRTAP